MNVFKHPFDSGAGGSTRLPQRSMVITHNFTYQDAVFEYDAKLQDKWTLKGSGSHTCNLLMSL